MSKGLEAKPSEALECLEWLIKNYIGNDYYVYEEELITIKQALIKSQEQEKALKIIFEKRVDINGLKKCIELDLPLTDNQRLHKYNHDYMMIGMEQLTEEEFNLLKAYFEKNIQN